MNTSKLPPEPNDINAFGFAPKPNPESNDPWAKIKQLEKGKQRRQRQSKRR
jgi:hypothetical protein